MAILITAGLGVAIAYFFILPLILKLFSSLVSIIGGIINLAICIVIFLAICALGIAFPPLGIILILTAIYFYKK